MSSIKSASERKQTLRSFGQVMALAFTVIGGLFLWRGRSLGVIFFCLALIFLSLAVFRPIWLDRVEKVWMQLAERLGVAMSYVIVTVTYFLAICPMGLLLRLLGKDSLGLKLDRDQKSYWVEVEKDGPGTRPYLPY